MFLNTKIIVLTFISICVNDCVTDTNPIPVYDEPTRAQLPYYLNVLEHILDNVADEKEQEKIGLDLYAGLFFMNVNLQHVLMKQKDLGGVRDTLAEITKRTDNIMEIFSFNIHEDPKRLSLSEIWIFKLISNMTSWQQGLPAFNKSLVPPIIDKEFTNKFVDWDVYEWNVFNFHASKPNITTSDQCIASLGYGPTSSTTLRTVKNCAVLKLCYDVIENGTDIGYALTHRILMLLMAKVSLQCVLFSPEEDQQLLEKLCTLAFEEAYYIALNNYQQIDLMMEQTTVCTLSGYSQFLRVEWLRIMREFQTVQGCFGTERGHSVDNSAECHSHITAVAAGVFSAAIRLILM